ncbi:hypothetical protein CG740_04990 [Streptomyces sp. CB01201]|uniref:plasmid mobilization protein n=1 Tax=Streptomyces sp. CB01201 TaxID=2020324 RepID=UPI000C274590|nr:hypothetical protein [Streptomyces sp. CB01201]PJN03765.1 hypothetical protein CG740_04990 [Streptomyces sp. CB01201]
MTEGGSQPDEQAQRPQSPAPGKPRSRPRQKKQRPAVSVRLSKTEKALIESGAKAVKLSVAGFLAHAGLAAARDLTRITDVTAAIADNRAILSELFAARRALTQGGNLLNQTAKALNFGGQPTQLDDDVDRMLATRTRVDTAIELFIAALEGGSPPTQPHPARDQFDEAA